MQKLLFFSRVALICNVCFLITFGMHYIPFIANGIVPNTIIIIGNVLSIVLNILLILFCAFFLMFQKKTLAEIPRWLVVVNVLFFILQVILLLK